MAHPEKFRLEHNGMEWTGSFQDALSAALSGLLDGGPIPVSLLLETEQRWAERTITRYDVRYLYSDEDGAIDRNHVLGMAVG